MSAEIVIAFLVFAGTVITALAGAYAVVKSESNKAIREAAEKNNEFRIVFAVLSSKVETLWEIYAEDAIRQARTSGMVAAKSPLAPTKKWDAILTNGGPGLEEIESDAKQLAEILNSPYDVAIELWARHKNELLAENGEEPVQVLWGTLLVVSMNAVKAHAKTDNPY